MAFRIVFNSDYAGDVMGALAAKAAKPKELPPEKVHGPALMLLAALQREGRLVDFLEQDVAGFSDEEVGAAARVVHTGCRKLMRQCFEFEPATGEPEGASMTVPAGFDAQRIRLSGNISGQPPFRGTLKHHGWVAKQIRLASVSDAVDTRVIAPAEVELA